MNKIEIITIILTIVLISTSALAQENVTITPSPTATTLTPTPTATVSTSTPIAAEKTFIIGPSVSITSSKITVEATSPAIITLDMVNPIVNEVNLEVQPILKVSSGVDVIASSFIISGGNQYTGHFIVRPGESNHITIQITSDELGSKTLESQIIYFPEGNKPDYHQLQQTMTIYVKEKTAVKPTPIPPDQTPAPTEKGSGFDSTIMIVGLLAAFYLVGKKSE